MSNSTPLLTVIIPCYNEKDAVADTVHSVLSILNKTVDSELIVVDDGSDDGSQDILQDLAKQLPRLKVICHEENRGYGASLKTGIRRAQGELIAITDADGTYPNDRIPDLVDKMTDADMVVGSRTGDQVQYSFIRKIPKFFLRRYCQWITGRKIPDMNSGLRIFRKEVAERFLHVFPNSFSFTTTITMAMLCNDYMVRFEPINYSERIGNSKIKPIRDTLRFIQLILRTGMYFAPLRAFAPVIGLLSLIFFASAAYDIITEQNLTDKTLIFLMIATNAVLFSLIADVIDKRAAR
jgi:glycosyltransferase involved in cell wall biosynthesis